MPLSSLLVEGKLDAEIVVALVGSQPGGPTVLRGGPKYALRRMPLEERRNRRPTSYLRDRDFDFDPPTDLSRPTHDAEAPEAESLGHPVLGWRWCRHEMENYLLEPALVTAATGWDRAGYERALLATATRIGPYSAARWGIGIVRRDLPPNYELETLPGELRNKEFQLPGDCGKEACFRWAREQVNQFGDRARVAIASLEERLTERLGRLAAAEHVEQVLLWHSGKNLMAGLTADLERQRMGPPSRFRGQLRDWVREHPADALELLPEWAALMMDIHAP